MLQQNKENREIRKLSKERMKEHHKYLVNKGKMQIHLIFLYVLLSGWSMC